MYDSTTVMRLVVNVPVLSEQIAVAFPIVSHASKWRTKLLSCIIFCSQAGKQLMPLRQLNTLITVSHTAIQQLYVVGEEVLALSNDWSQFALE